MRLEKISEAVKVLLESIGEDIEREGLLKTPERYAKALLFLTKGYTEDLEGIKEEDSDYFKFFTFFRIDKWSVI